MSERLIAIGDIHGCLTAFNRLLVAIEPTTSDTIVLLGDYIDRGPDSRGVIDRILQLRLECTLLTILGNHDEMLLSVLEGSLPPEYWVRYGGTSTLNSYGFSGDWDAIPVNHLDFLRSCSGLIQLDDFFFTHANYDADRPLSEQDSLLLRWTSLRDKRPKPHESGKTAILGHTADPQGEVFDLGYLKCIDTFCYGGMWLTALDVRCGTSWQTNEKGELRSP
ncbi:MAG: metallophosphoesterase family protein [Planctomycetota bacterium]|nr:metallophosphoesterase family protein [Planctomycetota bacterium]